MRHISPAKTGLSVGLVIALWHAMWVTLVAVGWAKAVMDFVLRLHFINLNYEMAPFVLSAGLLLVSITFVIGTSFGLLFALVWNWLSDRPDVNPPNQRQTLGSAA